MAIIKCRVILQFAKAVSDIYEYKYENQFETVHLGESKPRRYGLVTLKTETDLGFPAPGLINSIIAHKSLSDGWKPIKLIY